MPEKTHFRLSDIHGISRLAIDATLAVTNLVEAVQHAILYVPRIISPVIPNTPPLAITEGITKLVYRNIRWVTHLVGSGEATLLTPLLSLDTKDHSSFKRETTLAVLNGIIGDHLVATGNPLAIPMQLRRDGQPLVLEKQALSAAIPEASGKILLLVHGLCMNDLLWHWKGHNHGTALDMEHGYTPVYLHYNSGLHISTNGRAFADLIERLVKLWPVPVEEVVIIGHSMGGLATQSACYYGTLAGHDWLRHLRKIIFLGTPHQGAPLEQIGHWASLMLGQSPYTSIVARLGKLRSAGITDLRHGSLHDEDWMGLDRFAHAPNTHRPRPFLDGVQYYTMAATMGQKVGDFKDQLLGDGLVPIQSALGYHVDDSIALPFPPDHKRIGYGMSHLDLLHRHEVYEQMKEWLVGSED